MVRLEVEKQYVIYEQKVIVKEPIEKVVIKAYRDRKMSGKNRTTFKL